MFDAQFPMFLMGFVKNLNAGAIYFAAIPCSNRLEDLSELYRLLNSFNVRLGSCLFLAKISLGAFKCKIIIAVDFR